MKKELTKTIFIKYLFLLFSILLIYGCNKDVDNLKSKSLDKEISSKEYIQLVEDGDILKVEIVNNKNIVRVYIKADSLNKPFYIKKFNRNIHILDFKGSYQFSFQIENWKEYNELNEALFNQKNISEFDTYTIENLDMKTIWERQIFSQLIIYAVALFWILLFFAIIKYLFFNKKV